MKSENVVFCACSYVICSLQYVGHCYYFYSLLGGVVRITHKHEK